VIFTDKLSDYDFADFAVRRHVKEIDFSVATESEGIPYGCTSFPCVRAFRFGQMQTVALGRLTASAFSSWCYRLVNHSLIAVTESDHLALLLDEPGALVVGVDGAGRPASLDGNCPFYEVSSELFAALGVAVKRGVYVYRSADRQLLPIGSEPFDRLIRSPLADLSGTVTAKYFGGFVCGEDSSQDEFDIRILMDVADKTDFALGLLPPDLVSDAGLQFLSRPTLAIFPNANQSQRLRFMLRGSAARNKTAILEFFKRISDGEAEYAVVSLETAQEFGISHRQFPKAVENGLDTLVLFSPGKRGIAWDFAAAKRLQALLGKDRIQFFRFDVTENDLPGNLAIETVPTFVLFRKGKDPVGIGRPASFKKLFEAVVDAMPWSQDIPTFNAREVEDEIQRESESARDDL
jgi:hypothetical protein